MFNLYYQGIKDYTIDVTMHTLSETISEILEVLSTNTIEEKIELQFNLEDKVATSTYDPHTGEFGEWVAEDGFVEIPNSSRTRLRMEKVRNGVNETSISSRGIGLVILCEYKIITQEGDREIFGEDTTHYYTACGISISKASAFLRPQELVLPKYV